jgi:hypothetical protein
MKNTPNWGGELIRLSTSFVVLVLTYLTVKMGMRPLTEVIEIESDRNGIVEVNPNLMSCKNLILVKSP